MNQMQQLADRYVEVLDQRIGLDPQVTDDHVHFDTGPFHFLIPLHRGDPEYFHLMLFVAMEGEAAREVLERICSATTRKCKGAQLTVDEDRVVTASIEMVVASSDCLPTVEHLQAVLPRAIGMLQHAVHQFLVAFELHGIAEASSD
ncbi:hypothetical protein ABZS68_38595 [Streptomyces sp. NPDC005571]|uniref:hypothetical protein n=1 Tax=Streptomyces sp. NPDC005571 TaxID=3156888 RepID=UPI0033B3649C